MEPNLEHVAVTLSIGGHVVSITVQPQVNSPPWPYPPKNEGAQGDEPQAMQASAPKQAAPGDRVLRLVELLQKYGPMILALLKLFGLKANPAEIAAALHAFHALEPQA